MQQAEVLTYLTDATDVPQEGGRPRVGDRVELRHSHVGPAIEAWCPAGRRLGRLPPQDSAVLSGLLAGTALGRPRVTAEIAALVPRPRGGGADRIHIRVLAG